MASPSAKQNRLSHDFFELYRSYKRKTKTVLGWLKDTCNLTDVSITSFVAAAKSVRKQKIVVPSELYYVCKDALKLRITVAEQYKRQILESGIGEAKSAAIERHDFFISKFQLIFKNLFPDPPVSSIDVLDKQLSSSCEIDRSTDGKDNNYFAALPTVQDDFVPSTATSLPPPSRKAAITPGSDDEEDKDEFMVGDPLEETMIFLEYAGEMDALLSDVKKLWERVANDKCTLMYAALYTKCRIDIAVQMTRDCMETLGLDEFRWLVNINVDILANFNAVELRKMRCPIKYSQFTKEGACFEAVLGPSEKFLENLPVSNPYSRRMMSPKNFIPWETARWRQIPGALLESGDRTTLRHFVESSPANADRVVEERFRAALAMIEDMEHYLRKFKMSGVDLMTPMDGLMVADIQMRPLLLGLDSLIATGDKKGSNAEFSIWMAFVSESYNSYVWGGTALATNKNARLQLVQHYKEIGTSAKQVIQIVKSELNGDRFENLVCFAKDMETLAATSRWDLYSQAPLVNGLAMLEMSYHLMALGVNLWNDDGMAGFVLHAYNLVMQKNTLKRPIPILEKLCELLHDAVFMGHRPTSNFRSALFRFLGGKTERLRGRSRRDNILNRPDYDADIGKHHVIGDPPHLPSAWAEDRRIKPENLSRIYDMHARNYQWSDVIKVDRVDLRNFFTPKTKKQKRCANSEPAKSVWGPGDERPSDYDFDEEDWTAHFGRQSMRVVNDDLRGEINKLTEDAFPLARVNAFAVYGLMHDISKRMVGKLKQKMHSAKESVDFEMMLSPTCSRSATTAGALITVVMDMVDGAPNTEVKIKGRNGQKMVLEKDPSIMMRWITEVFVEAIEGKDLPEHYLWKHI